MDSLSPWLQDLVTEVITFLPKLIVALIVFIVSLLLSSAAGRWVRRSVQRRTQDDETAQLVARLARWGLLILGIVLALEQVEFNVTSFVAGLGIIGFTLGFALQDIAQNFVSGVLLLVRKPFSINDAVEVGDYAGSVMEINVRDTVLRTWDGEMVIVPNQEVFTNAIKNYSELPTRRRTIHIGLGYDEDVDQAKAAFMGAVESVDGVLADPPPEILAENLGDSALSLAIRFWVNQEEHSLFGTHSTVVQRIKETAEREEIDLPYPIQTVRLEGPWPLG